MNELDLFAAAIALVDPGERAALLDRECAGRPELRQRLDQLLAAHFQSNPLLDAPGAERTADYTPSSEPITSVRGEVLEQALKERSQFRQLTDALDPNLAVVTFWVYPDSFELFRHLRDHLYDRGHDVAGRPLPAGAPIAASRNGTASRGQ